MKTLTTFAITASVLFHLSPARAEPDAKAAYRDIDQTLGFVPGFMKAFPAVEVAAILLELDPATSLPGKTKELIGLAVAAQIPGQYCIFFHTDAAKDVDQIVANVKKAKH